MLKKNQRNWVKKDYVHSFLKFRDQNLSKFQSGTNSNF